MRRRLPGHSRLALLGQQPLGKLDTLAQIADLAARLLKLREQILAQHLDLFARSRIGAAANSLGEGASDREQQHDAADNGDRGEKCDGFWRHPRSLRAAFNLRASPLPATPCARTGQYARPLPA